MTQSALARHLDVKRQAIHDLVKRGIIEIGEDGKIDVATAIDVMAKTLRADSKTVAAIMAAPGENAPEVADAVPPAPTLPPPTEALDATSYHVARTLREAAEAKIAQLKLRQMAGELVNANDVRRAVVALSATARSGFERIPDKLADRLAALGDPHECHALLTAEIDQVLEDLAAGAESLKLDDVRA